MHKRVIQKLTQLYRWEEKLLKFLQNVYFNVSLRVSCQSKNSLNYQEHSFELLKFYLLARVGQGRDKGAFASLKF